MHVNKRITGRRVVGDSDSLMVDSGRMISWARFPSTFPNNSGVQYGMNGLSAWGVNSVGTTSGSIILWYAPPSLQSSYDIPNRAGYIEIRRQWNSSASSSIVEFQLDFQNSSKAYQFPSHKALPSPPWWPYVECWVLVGSRAHASSLQVFAFLTFFWLVLLWIS